MGRMTSKNSRKSPWLSVVFYASLLRIATVVMKCIFPLVREQIFEMRQQRYLQSISGTGSTLAQRRESIEGIFYLYITALALVVTTILAIVLFFIVVYLFNKKKKHPHFLEKILAILKVSFLLIALFFVTYTSVEFSPGVEGEPAITGGWTSIEGQESLYELAQQNASTIRGNVETIRIVAAGVVAAIVPLEWLSKKQKDT